MKNDKNALQDSVIKYCSSIGANALLVQGAGGNVSWKDEDTLWIKASGTCLAEAAKKDIFVAVDLPHLRIAIKNGDFSVTPKLCADSKLKPSIETLLHALMPHQVVVHLHAIEILAHLVRDNFQSDFKLQVDTSIHWTLVDYHKPGAALTSAVSAALEQKPSANVVFLANHGIVVGGNSIAQIEQTLNTLISNLGTAAYSDLKKSQHAFQHIKQTAPDKYNSYFPIQDDELHQLALRMDLFNQLQNNWALYPDHVVFLGAQAYIYKSWEAFQIDNEIKNESPELIFIQACGVFVKNTFNLAKQSQLRCYYEVLLRQKNYSALKTLTEAQVAELLNWDAEKYRLNLSK